MSAWTRAHSLNPVRRGRRYRLCVSYILPSPLATLPWFLAGRRASSCEASGATRGGKRGRPAGYRQSGLRDRWTRAARTRVQRARASCVGRRPACVAGRGRWPGTRAHMREGTPVGTRPGPTDVVTIRSRICECATRCYMQWCFSMHRPGSKDLLWEQAGTPPTPAGP